MPKTVVLYAPLGSQTDEISVTLRDPSSYRRITDWTNDPMSDSPRQFQLGSVGQLIGISGS